jgi:hypothetical protein
MSADSEQSETEKVIKAGYGTPMERLLLGDNSIEGTIRVVLYIGAFVLVFGSLFYFAG